jgi:O-antigen/teichoic acid export membrane protein
MSYASLWRRYPFPAFARWFDGLNASFRTGASGFITSSVTTAYQNLPVVLVAGISPANAVTFTLADKIYRIATLALVPVTQLAQGYVPAGGAGEELRRRAKRTVSAVAVVAALAALAFGAAAPFVAGLLADNVSVSFLLAFPFGLALGVILMSSVIGRACLVAFGAGRTLATAAVVSAVIGIPSVIVGTLLWGAIGAAFGLLTAEVVGLIMLSVKLNGFLR